MTWHSGPAHMTLWTFSQVHNVCILAQIKIIIWEFGSRLVSLVHLIFTRLLWKAARLPAEQVAHIWVILLMFELKTGDVTDNSSSEVSLLLQTYSLSDLIYSILFGCSLMQNSIVMSLSSLKIFTFDRKLYFTACQTVLLLFRHNYTWGL